jgi:arylsulfatase A-like enzyme
MRPNILLIMADQLGARFLNCYGSGVDSTPTLDRLARSGVRFDRFYVTAPVCAPNRASILTGRSPEVHGVTTNNYALQSDNPTYAHVLSRHGYRTAAFGKLHQTPMHWAVPTDLGFLGFERSVVSEDPGWGPWIDWVQGTRPQDYPTALAMTNGQGDPGRMHARLEQAQGATVRQCELKQQGCDQTLGPVIERSAWRRMYTSPLPAAAHDTVFLTECGLDFLRTAAADTSGTPFCCHISYVDPHDPYDPPEPYASMFDPEQVPPPLGIEWRGDEEAVFAQNLDSYLRFRGIHHDRDALQRLRALYHGSVRLIDDQVGRILAYLQESGLWERTIVIFTTDHGDMVGDHGLIAKGVPQYDSSIRVPLIVAGGPVCGGRESRRLGCSLDLFPSICEWAGVVAEDLPPLEGQSLVPACDARDDHGGWEEVAVGLGAVDTVVSDDRWRLTRYSQAGVGQLFNLAEDPDETRNLYTDPAFQARRTEMLERLVRARARPRSVVQYRNLAVRDGRKWDTNTGRSRPLYPNPGSPWLEDTPKPEWCGRDA